MAAHVVGYSDEWRGVLEDPAKLARFTSFVNAPGVPDPTVEFVEERGQPAPRASQTRPTGSDLPARGWRWSRDRAACSGTGRRSAATTTWCRNAGWPR